jgi:hypothetical protein
MDARKMLRLGIALICLALLLAVLPSITPSSLWHSTRWYEHSIDPHTGFLEPVPYRQHKGEPSPSDLTGMTRQYRIPAGEVGEMVSIMQYLAPGSSSEYGHALWTKYPDLAARLGYFQVVATRAKVIRYIGLFVFLGGLAFLFGALYQTYQAEKDIPPPHLPF